MGIAFPEAFLLTFFIEFLILSLLLRNKHGIRKIAGAALLANIATHPLVWFFFPSLGLTYALQLGISELFAFAAEALIYARLFPNMGLRQAALLSLACNATTFLFGLLLQII
jgi:hypothetical protein